MRQPRAELAVDHRAADCEQSADAPEEENQPGIAEIPGHQSRRGKDAASDDVADEQASGGEPADGRM